MNAGANMDGLVIRDDADAILFLRTAIEAAHTRIWVQQFVVDVRPSADRSGMIRYLLHALTEAVHRGVDVRVLLPVVMPPVGEPYDLNLPAVRFLAARGVSVRRYHGSKERPRHHAKVAIIDDDLLAIGNFNWTTRAFDGNAEQGVAIRSVSATRSAATKFEWLWSHRSAKPVAEYDPFMVRFLRTRRPSYWTDHLDYMDPYHRYPRFEERGRWLHEKLLGHVRSAFPVGELHGQRYVREMEALISNARRRVLVAMSALRATTDKKLQTLPTSLAAAARRGVDVRILYQVRDWPSTDLTADIGVLRKSGVRTRAWPHDSRMHIRSMVVDDQHVVIGSVGWTPHSIYVSEELSAHIFDRSTAMAFAARFDNWWNAGPRARSSRSHAARLTARASVAVATWSTCVCQCDACTPNG